MEYYMTDHLAEIWQTLSDEEMELYSRQIFLDDWDIDAQEKIKLSNILIIGVGGIGCITAELLARAGVGKITLIDQDQIDVSNLQRQVGFSRQDVGFFKADIMAIKLKEINPHIDIISVTHALDENNVDSLFQGQDLILDGCDNFKTRYLVNSHAYQFKIPLLSASAIGYEGQLLMVQPQSACYECLFPYAQQEDDAKRCSETGVLATVPNVMGALQAHHALLYLGLGKAPLVQKILLWNGLTMSQRIVKFEKDEDCSICRLKI